MIVWVSTVLEMATVRMPLMDTFVNALLAMKATTVRVSVFENTSIGIMTS